jgi:hypothetical protein
MSSDARPAVLVHATEELLEEYSFGRICEPQLGWLEEHLLICSQCQSDLDDIEEYKIFMKAGLAAFESERLAGVASLNLPVHPDVPVGRESSRRNGLWLGFALPRMPVAANLLAAGLLLALIGVTVWRMQSPVALAPAATIRLIALRGGEDVARAPSGRPLELVFDRSDLTPDLSYRAEIVDSLGRQMWSGGARIADENLSIGVDGPLQAGAYWVRLYSSAGQLLREFALNVG